MNIPTIGGTRGIFEIFVPGVSLAFKHSGRITHFSSCRSRYKKFFGDCIIKSCNEFDYRHLFWLPYRCSFEITKGGHTRQPISQMA